MYGKSLYSFIKVSLHFNVLILEGARLMCFQNQSEMLHVYFGLLPLLQQAQASFQRHKGGDPAECEAKFTSCENSLAITEALSDPVHYSCYLLVGNS